MRSYEIVREIFNQCSGNQMRDVFFEEAELEDPEAYVRGQIKGENVHLEREDLADGVVCVHVEQAGLLQKFSFTPLDD